MANPTYALNTIQSLVRSGRYRITLSAKQGAQEMGMDTADMETCVLGLTAKDFYKTMPAEKVPGSRAGMSTSSFRSPAMPS